MFARRALVTLPMLLALVGCEAVTSFFQNAGVLSADYRPKVITGAVRGKVVDRGNHPLVGALVTNGQVSYYSNYPGGKLLPDDHYDPNYPLTDPTNKTHLLTLAEGEFVLTHVVAGTNYIRASFDGVESASYQWPVAAGDFNLTVSSPTVGGGKTYQGLTEMGDTTIMIPVDGPVTEDAASQSVTFLGTSVEGDSVTAASGSALVYTPAGGVVGLKLKAPPGSNGTIVTSARVTYYSSSYDPSNPATEASSFCTEAMVGTNPITRSFSSKVNVALGSVLQSGPLSTANVTVASSAPQFQAYLAKYGEIKAKIELFGDGGVAVKDRNGNALSAVVSIQYRP